MCGRCQAISCAIGSRRTVAHSWVSSDTAQETVPIDRYSSPWRYSVLRLGRGYLMDSYSGRWGSAATSSAEPLRPP
jgi:hypothetical protein